MRGARAAARLRLPAAARHPCLRPATGSCGGGAWTVAPSASTSTTRAARRIVAAAAARRPALARPRPPARPRRPAWARRLYARSLLVLRALTDRRSGAVAAGARDGWAYVWPRDAGAAAIALAAAGYRAEARRVARFLLGLDLSAAARFDGDGAPVPGRAAQGDAAGWVAAAARATGLPPARRPRSPARRLVARPRRLPGEIPRRLPRQRDRLRRRPGRWAEVVGATTGRPGLGPRLGGGLGGAALPAASSLRGGAAHPDRLVAGAGRFGIVPSEDWPDAAPWTAPTAWSAWSLAALGERRRALRLLGDLRRASTAAGLLPERVGARTGLPLSTTPLAWSHAFAILAIRQLWPAHMLRRMEVRAARIADCGELARGMRSVVEEGRWLATETSASADELAQRFRASVEWDGLFLFVLEEDGEIVGSLGMQPTQADGVLSLGMWVLPEWRARGGGRRLIEVALDSLDGADVHKIELEVFPDNEAAIALYRSLGFEQEGLRRDHYRRLDGSLRSAAGHGAALPRPGLSQAKAPRARATASAAVPAAITPGAPSISPRPERLQLSRAMTGRPRLRA